MQLDIRYAPVKRIQSHILETNGMLASPLSISLEITNVCNQECIFCVQSKRWKSGFFEEEHNMSLGHVKALLNEAKSLGVVEFQISGGEPTCHPYFMEIVELAKEFQFRISVITNGVNFACAADMERLAGVLDSEHDLFIIALDAADRSNYEYLRGEDHFALVCNTLRTMREAGLPFATQTVILKNNISLLDDIWGMSALYGAKAHILVLPYRIKNVPKHIYPSDEETSACLAHLRSDSRCGSIDNPLVLPKLFSDEENTEAKNICSSGLTSCAVSARGEIHVCAFALDCGLSVGNINEVSLTDGWKKLRQFVQYTTGDNVSLHANRCPVKTTGLLKYDLTGP